MSKFSTSLENDRFLLNANFEAAAFTLGFMITIVFFLSSFSIFMEANVYNKSIISQYNFKLHKKCIYVFNALYGK